MTEPVKEGMIERLEGTLRTVVRPIITLLFAVALTVIALIQVRHGASIEWYIALAGGTIGVWLGSRTKSGVE